MTGHDSECKPHSPADLAKATDEHRPLDGYANNPDNCCWGTVGSVLLRLTPPADEGPHHTSPVHYRESMLGPANPRTISNHVCSEDVDNPDPDGRTHWMWAWGQFLDHQLDLTLESEEVVAVPIADDDPDRPEGTEGQDLVIPFKRSRMAPGTGIRFDVPREHANVLSAWIDASSVYGNDKERLTALIDPDGSGRLATSGDNLLPRNTGRLANAEPGDFDDPRNYYLAGDVRANEHVVLTSLHTVFVRLHNLRVAHLVADGHCDPAVIFTKARAWVAAVMQFITYCEFLPEVLGPQIEQGEHHYGGYRREVEPTISTEFSTAAYRLGHSMLPESIPVTTDDVPFAAGGRLHVRDAFFKPELLDTHGTPVFLDQLHTEAMRKVDPRIANDLRNFLFRFPGGPGGPDLGLLDLAALNIMRGRDHRIGRYNDVREGLGMNRKANFADVTDDAAMVARLEAAYDDVDDIDIWVGGLCEDPVEGAIVGETFHAILMDQFVRLRNGDRWHWRNAAYPRFGEVVDCRSCTGPCQCGPNGHQPACGEAVLTRTERDEISAGAWTLARVLLETESVSSGVMTPETNVFRIGAVQNLHRTGGASADVSDDMPGYGNNAG